LRRYLKSGDNRFDHFDKLRAGKLTTKKIKSVALLIGPEGGFAENEVQRAKDCGIVPISLGRRILRTETAAVVASSLILYESGKMEK